MTREEWLTATHPQPLFATLKSDSILFNRKNRLLSVAVCRFMADDQGIQPYKDVVDAAEALADGRITQDDLDDAHREAQRRCEAEDNGCGAFCWIGSRVAYEAWYHVYPVTRSKFELDEWGLVDSVMADLIRDVFIGPGLGIGRFETKSDSNTWLISPGELYPDGWFTAEELGDTVMAMARQIYEEKAFHELPILADAIEDIQKPWGMWPILDHLRSPLPHVRGCWALDLILGKH